MRTTPKRYFIKTIEIEAVRLDNRTSPDEVASWCGGRITYPGSQYTGGGPVLIEIDTHEGTMTASPGDWIVKEAKGKCYPIKDAIFRETYEAINA